MGTTQKGEPNFFPLWVTNRKTKATRQKQSCAPDVKRRRALFVFCFENGMKITSSHDSKPHKTVHSIRKTESGNELMTYRTGPVTISWTECMCTLHVLLELMVSLSAFHPSFNPVLEGTPGWHRVLPVSPTYFTGTAGHLLLVTTHHQSTHLMASLLVCQFYSAGAASQRTWGNIFDYRSENWLALLDSSGLKLNNRVLFFSEALEVSFSSRR